LTNRSLVVAVAVTVALQVLLVVTPALRDILSLEPLDPAHWALIVAIALTYLVAIEVEKWTTNRRPADS